MFLYEVAQGQDGGEGVTELDDAKGGNDGDEAEEIGDGGRDDESDGPVNRDDDRPEDFSLSGGKGRGAEEVHENVVVKDFDADVPVETGGDEATHDREHVADDLPAVGRDSLVGQLIGILALEVIYEGAVDEVACKDESLGAPHGLDEIARAFHLGHEFDEELRPAVRVDALHEAVDGANETVGIGEAGMVYNRGIFACGGVRGDCGRVCGRACGAEGGNREVGWAMRHHAHGDEYDQEVHVNGGVGEPAVFLQGADLTETEPTKRPDQTADGVA